MDLVNVSFSAWCRLFCISPARQKRGQPCWRQFNAGVCFAINHRFIDIWTPSMEPVRISLPGFRPASLMPELHQSPCRRYGRKPCRCFSVVFRFDKALHDFFAFTAGESPDCERIILIFGAFFMASANLSYGQWRRWPQRCPAAPPRSWFAVNLFHQPVTDQLTFEDLSAVTVVI